MPAHPAFIRSIAAIAPASWDRLGGHRHPFLRHAFLKALEESGSVGGRSGWNPHFPVLQNEEGELLAAAPLYLKSHSYGEYIFDQGWAQAFERAGGQYYPKLQVAIPFTPVPGPRLLVAMDLDGLAAMALRQALLEAMEALLAQHGLSSLHLTFADPGDIAACEERGYLQRLNFQFHWHNRGYRDFADFLEALSSRKRKAIRMERQRVQEETSLDIIWLQGHEIGEQDWDVFYEFYHNTYDRKWGRPYLTRDFFSYISQSMAEAVWLCLATKGPQRVAGALHIQGADTLYGRYWGCRESHKFLHFELCYYQAIEFALRHNLQRIEAGAQGEHKLQRGYLPVAVQSAHYLPHSGFRRAVAAFLAQERVAIEEELAALTILSPFRKAP